MTLKEIIECAYQLGYNFTEADAQDVIDTKPEWAGAETPAEAVADYLEAFGG
jgi:hypothetical protein